MNVFLRYIIGFAAAFIIMMLGCFVAWVVVSFMVWEIIPIYLPDRLLRLYVIWSLVAGYFLMPDKKS